jgi:hypothetical protein
MRSGFDRHLMARDRTAAEHLRERDIERAELRGLRCSRLLRPVMFSADLLLRPALRGMPDRVRKALELRKEEQRAQKLQQRGTIPTESLCGRAGHDRAALH